MSELDAIRETAYLDGDLLYVMPDKTVAVLTDMGLADTLAGLPDADAFDLRERLVMVLRIVENEMEDRSMFTRMTSRIA